MLFNVLIIMIFFVWFSCNISLFSSQCVCFIKIVLKIMINMNFIHNTLLFFILQLEVASGLVSIICKKFSNQIKFFFLNKGSDAISKKPILSSFISWDKFCLFLFICIIIHIKRKIVGCKAFFRLLGVQGNFFVNFQKDVLFKIK